jgi:hypothetical protein
MNIHTMLGFNLPSGFRKEDSNLKVYFMFKTKFFYLKIEMCFKVLKLAFVGPFQSRVSRKQ